MKLKTNLQLESLILILLCALFRIVRGKAESEVQNPKTVAIANFTTNIGDMIMTTPVFRAIKAKYPNCRVVVIGAGKSREVLLGNPDVDVYIPAKDFLTALFKLADFNPDLGVAINPNPKEIALLYLSGARGISVFLNEAFGSRAFRILSSLVANVPYTPGAYVPGQYLKLLSPLGIESTDTKKHLHVSVDAVMKVKKDMHHGGVSPDAPFVVIAPGAGQVFREWAPERFAEVARYMRDAHGVGIALAGGPGDMEIVKKIKNLLSGILVFDGTSQSIEELKALVSLSRAVVSNDSGIAYIAEAFNVPAVIIVGISDAEEHPKGSPLAHVIIPEKQEFVVRSYVSNLDTVNLESARRHLDSIPVSRVTAELDRILKT